MKVNKLWLIAVGLLALLFSACGGGGGGGGGGSDSPSPTEKTGNVVGMAIDSNGSSVSGATVTITNNSQTITDATGTFRFSNLNYGTYTLHITKDGLELCTKEFTLNLSSLDLGKIKSSIQYPPVTSDTTAPPAPAELYLNPASGNTVLLAWSAVTDESGISKYQVFRNGSVIAEGLMLNYSDSGRPYDVYDSYWVKAVDGAGNVSVSSAVRQSFFARPGNQAPIPRISISSAYFNQEITFDGSQSNDSDGSVVSYEWCIGVTDSTGLSAGCVFRATGSVVKYTFVYSGQLLPFHAVATLTIKDNNGAEGKTSSYFEVGWQSDQCQVFYQDLDNDGYSSGVSRVFCPGEDHGDWKAPNQLIATSGDCHDMWQEWNVGVDPLIYGGDFNPGIRETCSTARDYNCDGKITTPCKPVTIIQMGNERTGPDYLKFDFELRPEDGSLAGVTKERVLPSDVVGIISWSPDNEHCGWGKVAIDESRCWENTGLEGSYLDRNGYFAQVGTSPLNAHYIIEGGFDGSNGHFYPQLKLADGRLIPIDLRSSEVEIHSTTNAQPLTDMEVNGTSYTFLTFGNFQIPKLEFQGTMMTLHFYDETCPRAWEAEDRFYWVPSYYPTRSGDVGENSYSQTGCEWVSSINASLPPVVGWVESEQTQSLDSWKCIIPNMPASDRGFVRIINDSFLPPKLLEIDPFAGTVPYFIGRLDWKIWNLPTNVTINPVSKTNFLKEVIEMNEISYTLP